MNELVARQRRQILPPEERKRRILEVATELFLYRGFDAVSVEEITRAAGGSKRDPYVLFGDKLGLFREVVAGLCETSVVAIGHIDTAQDLGGALNILGNRILSSILSKKTLALHRLILAEAPRVPEIGQLFLSRGPILAYGLAASVIERYRKSAVNIDESTATPYEKAVVFVNTILGDLQLRALVGESVTPEEIERHVRLCVDLLLPGLEQPNISST